MKKLETAIAYVQRFAEGNNPINNTPADEGWEEPMIEGRITCK